MSRDRTQKFVPRGKLAQQLQRPDNTHMQIKGMLRGVVPMFVDRLIASGAEFPVEFIAGGKRVILDIRDVTEES